jgi:hypothetical protein
VAELAALVQLRQPMVLRHPFLFLALQQQLHLAAVMAVIGVQLALQLPLVLALQVAGGHPVLAAAVRARLAKDLLEVLDTRQPVMAAGAAAADHPLSAARVRHLSQALAALEQRHLSLGHLLLMLAAAAEAGILLTQLRVQADQAAAAQANQMAGQLLLELQILAAAAGAAALLLPLQMVMAATAVPASSFCLCPLPITPAPQQAHPPSPPVVPTLSSNSPPAGATRHDHLPQHLGYGAGC